MVEYLSCHIYKDTLHQNLLVAHFGANYFIYHWILTCVFRQSQNEINSNQRERAKKHFEKIDWNCDSKGQSALMMTLDPNYMGYNLVIYHMKEQ